MSIHKAMSMLLIIIILFEIMKLFCKIFVRFSILFKIMEIFEIDNIASSCIITQNEH